MVNYTSMPKRIANALDVAERCIPILGMRIPDQSGDRQAFRLEKFICETAILLYVSFRATNDESLRVRCHQIGLALDSYARSEEILALMKLRPNMIPELSVGHVCLTEIGVTNDIFHKSILTILRYGFKIAERAPWKDIEADWLASKCTHFFGPPHLASSIERSTLAVGFDCLTSRREELYAFTHATIYLTDFGHKSVIPPRELSSILCDAEGALIRCLDEDDFDLAAELLMTWPYFRAPLSKIGDFCLSVLMKIEDEVGFLPSLTLSIDQLSNLSAQERTKRLLDETYHTIYVMGLLCGSALDTSQSQAPFAIANARSLLESLSSLIPPKKTAPRWETYYNEMLNEEKASLLHLIVGISLRRALLANNIALVRQILILCFDSGITRAPCMENAMEIISRFTLSV